jgi:hypothetical protein
MLTDATNTTYIGKRLELRIEIVLADYRRDNDHAWIETAKVSIVDERPKKAVDKRQAAVTCFVYKHLHTDYDIPQMIRDLSQLRALGRTLRWQQALTTWMGVLEREQDTAWAITQYSIYTNYAAM